MKNKSTSMRAIPIALLALASASFANAQETLTYVSAPLDGTTTTLETDTTESPPVFELPPSALVPSPISGNIVGELTVMGTPGANGSTVDGNFSFIGTGGVDIPFASGSVSFGLGGGADNYCFESVCIDLTLSNRQVTGATVSITDDIYNGTQSSLNIGPGGDSISYTAAPASAGGGSCLNVPETYSATSSTYEGPTINNCTITANDTVAGEWTVQGSGAEAAPEIDPSGAAGALTLLCGGLAVLLGKSRRPSLRVPTEN